MLECFRCGVWDLRSTIERATCLLSSKFLDLHLIVSDCPVSKDLPFLVWTSNKICDMSICKNLCNLAGHDIKSKVASTTTPTVSL